MGADSRAPELQRVIERLPAGFDALREEARAEGYLFVERLAADWEAGRMRFGDNGETLLAARVAGVLAGFGGLTTEPILPGALRVRRVLRQSAVPASRHRPHAGDGLLERARTTGPLVTVNAAPASASFWESLGFTPDMRDGHTHLYRGFC